MKASKIESFYVLYFNENCAFAAFWSSEELDIGHGRESMTKMNSPPLFLERK
jgi:hypothetical protein